MSRPTFNQFHGLERGEIPDIGPEAIDAAILEGRRLRAEAFARWLRAGAAAVRAHVAGATLRMRRLAS